MLGYRLIKESELPFYKEVHRLIDKYPEYLEGIKKGVVHLAFDPGQRQPIVEDHNLLREIFSQNPPKGMKKAKPMTESEYRTELDARENPAPAE